MSLAGTRLYGCEQLAEKLTDRTDLLPIDGSWKMQQGASITHKAGDSYCAVIVPIVRNFEVFFIKNILVVVLIVQAAMLSLWLNPLIPPLMGGRFGIAITAMLTISNVVNVDLTDQLGRLPKNQLLWLDYFYFFQFAMIILSISESAVVHVLIRHGKDALATQIDHEFRVLLPFVMYPLLAIGLVLWAAMGKEYVPLGASLISLAIVVPIVGGVVRALQINRRCNAG